MRVPFNVPYFSDLATENFKKALSSNHHSGNGEFSSRCVNLLKTNFDFLEVFLTPSGTASLEMAMVLIDIQPGDEVIVPSYTFSSSVNCFVLFGAKPIFCDVDPTTLNIDPNKIEGLITKKTKAIVPIDYAGASCDIKKIVAIANRYDLKVVLDAAQSLSSKADVHSYVGQGVDLAISSFHETKNYSCGEGGCLIVNNPEYLEKAYFIQEKGTNRKQVLDGVVSKYGWVLKGSSYLLSDLLAAVLYSQLLEMKFILETRKKCVDAYRAMFESDEYADLLSTIKPQSLDLYNSHAFFIVFHKPQLREIFISYLKTNYNVFAYIGYVPLHNSQFGSMVLKTSSCFLPHTDKAGMGVVRLPLHVKMGSSQEMLEYTVAAIRSTLGHMLTLRDAVGHE